MAHRGAEQALIYSRALAHLCAPCFAESRFCTVPLSKGIFVLSCRLEDVDCPVLAIYCDDASNVSAL